MRITYDPEADVAYVYLNDGSDPAIARSSPIGEEQLGITVDFAEDGQVLGLEIMGAKQRFGPSGAASVQLEILRAAEQITLAESASVTVMPA